LPAAGTGRGRPEPPANGVAETAASELADSYAPHSDWPLSSSSGVTAVGLSAARPTDGSQEEHR